MRVAWGGGIRLAKVCDSATTICAIAFNVYITVSMPASISGRDSSVGMATLAGLDDPRIESRWGRDFPRPSRPALEPTQPPIQWVLCLFPGGKAAGAWR